MVKSVLEVSDIVENKSLSKKSFSETEERVKNADRLAKSLKSYLSNSLITTKKRGPPRDARICQLNAAYKYIVHLETNLKNICNRSNQELPEDCSLVHNTNIQANNLSYRRRLENSDMTPQTPSQQRNHLVHESSTLSGATSASSPSTNVSNPEKADDNTSSGRRALKTLRKFDNIDASPIMGNENHFLNENYFLNEMDNFVYDINTKSKTAHTSSSKSPASRKRKFDEDLDQNNNNINMLDLNLHKETTNLLPSNKATPSDSKRSVQNTPKNNINSTNFHTPDLNFQQQNLEETDSGRKTYFLRSTTKLKNMLIANNPVSKSSPAPNKRTPRNNNAFKKNLPSRFLDTSIGSTRSTSVTTTPSVPNSNMSTNSSNEFEGLDAKNLLKIDLSHEQVAQIYESNQRSN